MYQTIQAFKQIGKLSSTHGLDGAIHLTHHLKGKKVLKKLAFIFIEIKTQSYIPYALTSCSEQDETSAIIYLEDVNTVEAAKLLAGKGVFIPEAEYTQVQPQEVTMDFAGFTVYDHHDKRVGSIEEITEYPGQLMASILLDNGNEALIPLVEQHIININTTQKTLTLRIPDGLIDIYL